MEKIDFRVEEVEYSKKLSDCFCGEIVAVKDSRFLLAKIPELSEKEKVFFANALNELKLHNKMIVSKADIYFFLKEYCLERMILLTKEQRDKISTLLEWESIGESILTPLLTDPDFEEIVINGPKKPIMVYHRVFGWLTTNVSFENEERIRTIINKMASPLGRQLSYHKPMLNAVLKDGSRLNASINPVAFSGINATIRKFKENPFTPSDLAELGTISFEAMAFLWLAMQSSCSILVCGNTGSGKTTTLNALFCFLPKDERIVVVEETPELLLPQNHTIKMNTAEQLNITMSGLIDNTFRMRPDRVVIGEIRTKEESNAFVNTMLAGQAKGSYATFHAESAQEAIQRFVSFGVMESTLKSIDLVLVQRRINLIKNGNRIETRKVTQICEIIENNGKVTAKPIFEHDFEKKLLRKVTPSKRVKEKIKQAFQCKAEEVDKLIETKEKLLRKLTNVAKFMEFYGLASNED